MAIERIFLVEKLWFGTDSFRDFWAFNIHVLIDNETGHELVLADHIPTRVKPLIFLRDPSKDLF